jgi:hypothetical protein
LVYVNDNKNLVNSINQKVGITDKQEWIEPCWIETGIISDYLRNKNELPDYMVDYLDQYGDQFASMSPREIENQLLRFFYEEVFQSDSEFISGYFRFEKDLKSMVTLMNCHLFNHKLPRDIIDHDKFVQKMHGTSFSASLMAEFPFLTELSEILQSRDPESIEKKIDLILWDWIDQNTSMKFFMRQQVFGYFIKLNMVKRWLRLYQNKSEEHIYRIIERVTKDFEI